MQPFAPSGFYEAFKFQLFQTFSYFLRSGNDTGPFHPFARIKIKRQAIR